MNRISRLILLTIVSSGDVKSSFVREGHRSLIVDGEKVDNTEKYPYIAYVGNCGAVLVAKNVFLTAAHCDTPLQVVLNKDLFDSEDIFYDSLDFQVTDVLNHPKWLQDVDNLKSYDFRLIRVSGFPDAKPIVLDDGNNGYTNTDELLTIMGWGKTGVNKKLSEDLREADVNVIDYKTCNEKYDGDLDETVMFCAGKSSGGTYISTCEGDNGGPIVKRDVDGNDVLVGIVSFSADECGNSNHPTVFAKVSGVYEWLVEGINNWDCSQHLENRKQRLLQGDLLGGPPEVQESPLASDFDKMKCAYILDNTTIRQAVKMYLSKRYLAILIYFDPKYWDTSKVTDMSRLFYQTGFNADISGWDTSKVTDTTAMFAEAYSFNQDLSQWDLSKVTNTAVMFAGAESLNQDLTSLE